MQAAVMTNPQPDREAEEVMSAYLAKTHGDVHAAFEMLALAAVAEIREYEGLIRRNVSRGYMRVAPASAGA